MAAKGRVVLRTAFPGDEYVSGNHMITSEGTEVGTQQAKDLTEEAARVGVSLVQIEPDAEGEIPPAINTEGKSN